MCATEDRLIRGIHCVIQARPEGVASQRMRLGNREMTALQVPLQQQSVSLDISFEDFLGTLAAEHSCFTEPDGWFIWTGWQGRQFWSLSGQLTDNGQRILYAELKGDCPMSVFKNIETLLSRGKRALMFQLPQQGIFLERTAFLQLMEDE